ncbi:MAG: hypothetical protein ACRYFX_11140 [Janthinobacterium lividum]
MELTVHQARFGQNEERGFALLDTTHPDTSRIRKLSPVANLAEYPPDQLHWEPALRGFAWDDFYVLLKTFPDNSPGMRRDRVFSHALLLETKQLTYVADLRLVLDNLPTKLNKSSALTSFKLAIPGVPAEPLVLTPRLGNLLQVLVLHADTKPIIWADQLEFEDAVCLAWRVMWPALRQQFKFGIGFSVRDVKAVTPQLVAVPNSLLSAWHEYPIIKPTDANGSFNEVERYLLGDLTKSTDLADLLTALKAFPARLSDLASIQAVAQTATRLAEATLPDLLALASVVATLQPSPAHAPALKQELVASLLTAVASSSIEELIQLRTFGWQAEFGPVATRLDQAVTERFAKVVGGKPAIDLAPLLARLDSDAAPNWWSKSMEAGMRKIFAFWKPELAPLVYSLWEKASTVAGQLLKLLPMGLEIEADLVAQLPSALGKDMAQAGVSFAQRRKWLTLHMACALQRWPLETALSKQLEVDTLPHSVNALRYAQQQAPAKNFVKISAELLDERLIQLAGEVCATQPKLLEVAEVVNVGWQRVWLASLLEKQPAPKVLDRKLVARTWILFDHLIAGGSSIPGLLSELGKTVAADMRDYPRRAEIWGHLNEGKQAFLFATAVSVVQHEQVNSAVEAPLVTTLGSLAFARHYLTPGIEIDAALSYLTWFGVSEPAVTEYLSSIPRTINSIQSQQLGRLIASRTWTTAANQLYTLAQNTPALRTALAECLNLLSVFNKLASILLVRKEKKVPIKSSDWWQMLLGELRFVYAKGPTDDKIWLISGGSEDIINNNQNGMEQWADLLNRLQRKPPIPVRQFIATLVKENKRNQTFQLLYDLLLHDANA